MQKQPAVYVMSNRFRGTVYVGVTSDLMRRVYEHKNGVKNRFSGKYDYKLLVWYEQHDSMESAILREKQLKGGSRQKKVMLVESANPFWQDLYDEMSGAKMDCFASLAMTEI